MPAVKLTTKPDEPAEPAEPGELALVNLTSLPSLLLPNSRSTASGTTRAGLSGMRRRRPVLHRPHPPRPSQPSTAHLVTSPTPRASRTPLSSEYAPAHEPGAPANSHCRTSHTATVPGQDPTAYLSDLSITANATDASTVLQGDGTDIRCFWAHTLDTTDLQSPQWSHTEPQQDPLDFTSPHAFATKAQKSVIFKASRDKEMASHAKNGTWERVPRQEAIDAGIPVYWPLWIDKDKPLADGTTKQKSRVVCNSNSTASYDSGSDTFASTGRMASFRIIMSIAANNDLDMFTGDFSTAFLNVDALETVYMEQVPGYAHDRANTILKLKKGLYGTKTANRGWQQELHKALTKFGLSQCKADHGMYVLHSPQRDDCLLAHLRG